MSLSRYVVLAAFSLVLHGSSDANAQLDSREARQEIQQRLAAADATLARLETILAEPLLTATRLSAEQVKEIRATMTKAKAAYQAAHDKVRHEENETDKSGPIYAVKKIPEAEQIVKSARELVLSKLLTPEQRQIVQAEWDRIDAEKKKASAAKK